MLKEIINCSSYYERSTSSNVQQIPEIKKSAKRLPILKKNKLPGGTKEENMDSTDSALDETVSSFLHGNLFAYIRFSISVQFFVTY